MKRMPAPEREELAEWIQYRMAPVITVLGIMFVLVVIAEGSAEPGTTLARVLAVAGWVLWFVFVGEFVLRLVIAPSKRRFMARNWWQLIFLALPFLRFVQALRAARLARAGRIASSAVRGTRSAGAALRSRLAWLVSVHAIVVLASAELVNEFVPIRSYGEALYRTAIASVAGEPIGIDDPIAKLIDVILAIYSVMVFATVAGALGSYFLERRDEERTRGASASLPVTTPTTTVTR
jgi:voltage-gated potassium channel